MLADDFRTGFMVENYRIGRPYGAGAYATTYELLDATCRPTGRVVQFLRQPFNDSDEWLASQRNLSLKGMKTDDTWDATPLPEIIDRLMEGQRLLDDAKILNLKMGVPLEESLATAGGATPRFPSSCRR